MDNIEECNGRISAFKEMISLMNLINPIDSVTKSKVQLLIEHAQSQIKREEFFIDESLKKMEVDSNGRTI